MAGFFKCMLRANTSLCGDLEGSVTLGTKGKRSVSIEKGKVIAWATSVDDIELSKQNTQSVDLLDSDIVIKDLASGGGKIYKVNAYKIIMRDGTEGILRVKSGEAYKVLSIIK